MESTFFCQLSISPSDGECKDAIKNKLDFFHISSPCSVDYMTKRQRGLKPNLLLNIKLVVLNYMRIKEKVYKAFTNHHQLSSFFVLSQCLTYNLFDFVIFFKAL